MSVFFFCIQNWKKKSPPPPPPQKGKLVELTILEKSKSSLTLFQELVAQFSIMLPTYLTFSPWQFVELQMRFFFL